MVIMNHEHKDWLEFLFYLGEAIKKEGCNSETEKPIAKSILDLYDDIDLSGTFEYFENKGGYCDCEIMYNVVDWDSILNS